MIAVKELYDRIVSQMTPEEALMKLLEGTLNQYYHLKILPDEEEGSTHALFIMTSAAVDMDWNFMIEKSEDEEHEVRGIITGTTEYIDEIGRKLKIAENMMK